MTRNEDVLHKQFAEDPMRVEAREKLKKGNGPSVSNQSAGLKTLDGRSRFNVLFPLSFTRVCTVFGGLGKYFVLYTGKELLACVTVFGTIWQVWPILLPSFCLPHPSRHPSLPTSVKLQYNFDLFFSLPLHL